VVRQLPDVNLAEAHTLPLSAAYAVGFSERSIFLFIEILRATLKFKFSRVALSMHNMAITKAKKKDIIEKIEGGLKDAESVVFVSFRGLPVKEVTAMRKGLREKGVSYYVAKKTLVRRALSTKAPKGNMPDMPGELALAWSTDPIAAAKGVYEFAKTRKEQLSLVGGIYEGSYMSKDEIMSLATIPSREELLSKFVGMLNESIAQVVRTLDARAKQMETASAA
jgi:large subunit ribosomal protein L10